MEVSLLTPRLPLSCSARVRVTESRGGLSHPRGMWGQTPKGWGILPSPEQKSRGGQGRDIMVGERYTPHKVIQQRPDGEAPRLDTGKKTVDLCRVGLGEADVFPQAEGQVFVLLFLSLVLNHRCKIGHCYMVNVSFQSWSAHSCPPQLGPPQQLHFLRSGTPAL